MFSSACLQGKGFDLCNRSFFNEIFIPFNGGDFLCHKRQHKNTNHKKNNMIHMEKHKCIKHKIANRNTNRLSCSNNVQLRQFNTIICLQFLAKLTCPGFFFLIIFIFFSKVRISFEDLASVLKECRQGQLKPLPIYLH